MADKALKLTIFANPKIENVTKELYLKPNNSLTRDTWIFLQINPWHAYIDRYIVI